MKQPIEILTERIEAAIENECGRKFSALVKLAADAKFGDFQANGIMSAAKHIKANPRQLAEKIMQSIDLSDICQTVEVAGPGFINLRLKTEFVASCLMDIFKDKKNFAVEKAQLPKNIVVDFSGPNIAKQMHVGHLRSTIIGDCICRLNEFLGHNVIRQNHIGDWGTQFGMLIAFLKKKYPKIISELDKVHIADLEDFYKKAKALNDEDKDFEKSARDEVVKLHNYNLETIKVWQYIVDESRNHYQPIYNALGVNLDKSNERGESFYADKLADVVMQLKKQEIAIESEGAVCVFPQGFKNKEGQPLPFIIQKSDGAFLYATTDMAALKFRIENLKADKIIYVTDARQTLHFQMLFACAKISSWIEDNVELKHITFGTMLGADNKPFKTRSGENVKLKDLLEEAVERAAAVVNEKNPDLSSDTKAQIANAVGIGAVKYADYSNNRETDYIFSFDKMLAMDGNTAPYMQYAYARIKSIERKAIDKGINTAAELAQIVTPALNDSAEIELAKHLIQFGAAVKDAAIECRPNYLTGYLYELAQKFSSFYNSCPVLTADEQTRPSRLLLCELTARAINIGLSRLLGINVVEQM